MPGLLPIKVRLQAPKKTHSPPRPKSCREQSLPCHNVLWIQSHEWVWPGSFRESWMCRLLPPTGFPKVHSFTSRPHKGSPGGGEPQSVWKPRSTTHWSQGFTRTGTSLSLSCHQAQHQQTLRFHSTICHPGPAMPGNARTKALFPSSQGRPRSSLL